METDVFKMKTYVKVLIVVRLFEPMKCLFHGSKKDNNKNNNNSKYL